MNARAPFEHIATSLWAQTVRTLAKETTGPILVNLGVMGRRGVGLMELCMAALDSSAAP